MLAKKTAKRGFGADEGLGSLADRGAQWHKLMGKGGCGVGKSKSKVETDRRSFLVGAGKYAVVVPPAMTFLLSTTLVSEAVAGSSHASGDGYDHEYEGDHEYHGRGGGEGGGDGGWDHDDKDHDDRHENDHDNDRKDRDRDDKKRKDKDRD